MNNFSDDKIEKANLHIIKTEEQIKQRVEELASMIDGEFRNEEIIVVGILKGSFIFFSDLIRQMKSDVVCEFLGTSDYDEAPLSSGEVKIILDLNSPIVGKNVLLVEDIVSNGLTFHYIARTLMARNPKKLKTCCFVKKGPKVTDSGLLIDHIGFVLPDDNLIVGYGMDYNGYFRNLPNVAKITNKK